MDRGSVLFPSTPSLLWCCLRGGHLHLPRGCAALLQGWGVPLQSGSGQAGLSVLLPKSAVGLLPLARGGQGARGPPVRERRAACVGAAAALSHPGRARDQIKSHSRALDRRWELKALPGNGLCISKALLLSPSPACYFCPLSSRAVCQVCQGLVPGRAASPAHVWGALSNYWAVQPRRKPSSSARRWGKCGFGAALGLSVKLRRGSSSLQWAGMGQRLGSPMWVLAEGRGFVSFSV